MITKSEKERQELFKKINDVANQLRNKVDGWDFKAYILGFLFYRYLSEDFNNYVNQLEKSANFNYQDWEDEKITEKYPWNKDSKSMLHRNFSEKM